MKKLSLGFLIALITFTFGAFAANFLSFADNQTPQISVEDSNLSETRLSENNQLTEIQSTVPEDSNKEYFSGWYSLKNYKKMPEVTTILLSIDDYLDDGIGSEKPISSAGIFTTLSEDLGERFAEDDWTIIENNNVKFKTKKLKGIVYRFEGNFFKNKTTGEDGEKLLRGTLQKFVKGKKVAEVRGDFQYYQPKCSQ